VSSHETLGLLLVRDGLITRPQLYDALRLQRQNNRLLGTCLLSLGYISAEQLLDILSRQLAIPALPPGALSGASPDALARVPGELAMRLRVLPYSWDGEMLGVAVTDGRSINHLHEVAFHAQSAVGAYVALEVEIEAALRQLYPDAAAQMQSGAPAATEGRLRPARAGPAEEVPSRDFGAALGLEDEEPVLLEKRKSPAVSDAPPTAQSTQQPPAAQQPPTTPQPQPPATPAPNGASSARADVITAPPPRAPIEGPLPPAPTEPLSDVRPALESLEMGRMPFYDAVEKIYDVHNPAQVGQYTARALLNYFSRLLVLRVEQDRLEVIGFGGIDTPPASTDFAHVPAVATQLHERTIAYGQSADDPRAGELAAAFGLGPAPTSLIAPIADILVVYADNGAIAELYDDLHDVELLFKEAETALGMLSDD
jgi:hypothetical protein